MTEDEPITQGELDRYRELRDRGYLSPVERAELDRIKAKIVVKPDPDRSSRALSDALTCIVTVALIIGALQIIGMVTAR